MGLEFAAPQHAGIIVDAQGGVRIPGDLKVDYRLAYVEGSSTTFKIRYLKERWHWFNTHSFNGEMEEPKFKITSEKVRLGFYSPGEHLIGMSKYQFNLGHDRETLNTILHEMCHQYVFEVNKVSNEDAHGPNWQGVMMAVGLPPSKTSMADVESITPVNVLTVRKELRELKDGPLRQRPVVDLNNYTLVRYVNPGRLLDVPAIVRPSAHEHYLDVVLLSPDGQRIGERIRLSIDALLAVTPLKSKTAAYKSATRILELLRK